MTRNKVLKFGVLTVMAVIVGRLFFIQILQHEMWTEKAAAQQTLTNTLPAERGEIYMMDGSECDGLYGDCGSDAGRPGSGGRGGGEGGGG